MFVAFLITMSVVMLILDRSLDVLAHATVPTKTDHKTDHKND